LAEEQGSEPAPEELLAGLREVPIGEFLLSIAGTLLTLTHGKLELGDLEQARVGIDALGSLVPSLEGQIEDQTRRELESALAGLRVAYADAVRS
jgi:hypothetical protein